MTIYSFIFGVVSSGTRYPSKNSFNYLAAGRDLLAFNSYSEPGQKYALMGALDFDLEPSEKHSLINDIKFDEKNLMVSRSASLLE
jgi:hypothetical protein